MEVLRHCLETEVTAWDHAVGEQTTSDVVATVAE
jgi:hypothetical protein